MCFENRFYFIFALDRSVFPSLEIEGLAIWNVHFYASDNHNTGSIEYTIIYQFLLQKWIKLFNVEFNHYIGLSYWEWEPICFLISTSKTKKSIMCVWLHNVHLKWEKIMTMFVLVQYVHKIHRFHQVYWWWVCRNECWWKSLLHNIGLKPSSYHIVASLRKFLRCLIHTGPSMIGV